MKLMLIFSTLVMASCSSNGSGTPPVSEASMGEIYWSDGDSGRLDGVPFRLKDIDAPETGAVGVSSTGAKCEQERERGYKAKAFIVALTANASIMITNNYGPDRYDRNVVDLSADGIDVAAAGVEANHLKSWPHDANGSSLSKKPIWCD